MTAFFADQHPGWCVPDRCDVNDPVREFHAGAHRSALVVVDELGPLAIGRDRLQVASAYLYRPAGVDRTTFLVLDSGGNSISLPLLKAVGALIQIARLVGQGEASA
jgi:hypothetical protein